MKRKILSILITILAVFIFSGQVIAGEPIHAGKGESTTLTGNKSNGSGSKSNTNKNKGENTKNNSGKSNTKKESEKIPVSNTHPQLRSPRYPENHNSSGSNSSGSSSSGSSSSGSKGSSSSSNRKKLSTEELWMKIKNSSTQQKHYEAMGRLVTNEKSVSYKSKPKNLWWKWTLKNLVNSALPVKTLKNQPKTITVTFNDVGKWKIESIPWTQIIHYETVTVTKKLDGVQVYKNTETKEIKRDCFFDENARKEFEIIVTEPGPMELPPIEFLEKPTPVPELVK